MDEKYAELEKFLTELAARVTAKIKKYIADRKVRELAEVMGYAVEGGKKLRPGIAVLALRSLRGYSHDDENTVMSIASVAELIHTASLALDDILDGDMARRGKKSAHGAHGIVKTVIGAGALVTMAFRVGIGRSQQIGELAAQVAEDLMTGNGMDVEGIGYDREAYLKMIELKTASLFRGAARMGAIVGNGTPDNIEFLSLFGWHVGMQYQIIDDLADVFETERTGAPTGFLEERKVTLPLIVLWDRGTHYDLLDKYLVKSREFTLDDYKALVAALRESGALDAAMMEATKHNVAANEALAKVGFVDEKHAALLKLIPDYARDALLEEFSLSDDGKGGGALKGAPAVEREKATERSVGPAPETPGTKEVKE